MTVIVTGGNGGNWQPIPTGTQPAVCAMVVDLGMQTIPQEFGGGARQKVAVVWQLGERQTEGDGAGKLFQVSRIYTASLHEKASLRLDLEAWRGRAFSPEELGGFDIEKLVGANCLLTIVETVKENGDKRQKVHAVSMSMKGMEKLAAEPMEVPEWITKMQAAAIVEGEPAPAGRPTPPGDDDLPF